MKLHPDINDTLRHEGDEAVRARSDNAHKYERTGGSNRSSAPYGETKGNRRPSRIKLIPYEQITLTDAGEEWTIKGITPRQGVGVTWGASQTYKSFLELDQDLHIALGWGWRGHRVQQGPVVYCAFEGGMGVRKRVVAWRQHKLPEHDELVPFYLQPMRLELVREVDALIDAIGAQLDGINPVKISLDTLNRSMSGSESKDADMGAYLGAADKLREAFGCFVNIIHHPGWDASRLRGHTSLPCAAEVEIAVTSPGKLLSMMEIKKMKDEETGLILHSKLEKVTVGWDADGDPITSLVATEAEAPVAEGVAVKLTKNQQTMFSILHAAKRPLSQDEWNERAKAVGIGVKRHADLYDLREALKAKGLVLQLGDQWSVKHES
jgi:hypothetical protein